MRISKSFLPLPIAPVSSGETPQGVQMKVAPSLIDAQTLMHLNGLSRSNGRAAPIFKSALGVWSGFREHLPFELLPNLRQLILLPKGESRLGLQREINAVWGCLCDAEKMQVLEGVGLAVLTGEISPPPKVAQLVDFFETQRLSRQALVQTPSTLQTLSSSEQSRLNALRLRGPAMTWLHSTLSSMNSNGTLKNFLRYLTPAAVEGVNLALKKKPNRNMIDVDFDYKHFLKFNASPITLPREAHGREVAIVGSGVAAAIAARMLLQAGAKPVIFERDSKVGGRLESRRFHDEQGNEESVFSEVGGMRFPAWGRTWFHLLKSFGVKTTPCFPNPGTVPTVLQFKSEVIDWPVGSATPDSVLFRKIGADFRGFMGRLIQPIEQARNAHDVEQMQKIFQGYLDRYGNKTFQAALIEGLKEVGVIWSRDEIEAFGALGIGTGGLGVFYPVSFVEILRVMVNRFEEDQYLLPDGAAMALNRLYDSAVQMPNGCLASLKTEAKINLETKVTAIKSSKSCPLVEFKAHDGRVSTKAFAAVIVTTTPRAMQDMGLARYVEGPESLISPSAARALGHLNLVSASKLFIRTKTKFWLDEKGLPRDEKKADGSVGPIPQNIQTDELAHGVYCLDYPDTEHGVVMVNYAWGEKSDRLMHKSPEERLAEFKKSIERVSPAFAANLIPLNGEIHCVDWQNQAGHYGAFKLNAPGQEANQQAALYQFQEASKGVVLAGDSLSHMGGWVEGALQTGIHAACAVAVHLGGSVAEGSPLDLDKNRFEYEKPLTSVDPEKASRMLGLTASELVDGIADGSVLAMDYMKTILLRAKELSSFNALITLNEEAALKAASKIDEDRASGIPLKPLAGLPIVVKDNINTRGVPTTAGTPALRNFIPHSNAPVLQALLDAGAILVAKANMHELSFGVTSTNLSSFAKPIRNPYNRDLIPGGSSGGTASAIASRIVSAGLGTDTGGSTRIPAALTGIVGFRPSVGNGGKERRYSAIGVVPVSSTRDTVGPMARTVRDVALLDSVICGVSQPKPVSLKGMRFGVPGVLWGNLDHEVAAIMNMAKDRLSDAGVEFVAVDMPSLLDLNQKISFPVAMHEAGIGISEYLQTNRVKNVTLDTLADQIASPDVRSAFHAVKADVFGGLYRDAIRIHRPQLRALYDDYFRINNIDALFFPTTPIPAIPLDLLHGSSTVSVNGGPELDVFKTMSQNTEPGSNAGLPGLSMPVGLTRAGLPVGMEIDGPVGGDSRLLSIGLAMEVLFGRLPAPRL